MGKIFTTELELFMEGLDQPLIVNADQRDYAAWEAFDGNNGGRVTMQRFLGWNAAKRSGAVSVSWPEFGRLCIQVYSPGEEEEELEGPEGEQGLDPGLKDRSGA
jgi:hypothetical protein